MSGIDEFIDFYENSDEQLPDLEEKHRREEELANRIIDEKKKKELEKKREKAYKLKTEDEYLKGFEKFRRENPDLTYKEARKIFYDNFEFNEYYKHIEDLFGESADIKFRYR